jgi:hypothetical protein
VQATVTFYAEQTDGNEITISYVSDEAEPIRGIAIDVELVPLNLYGDTYPDVNFIDANGVSADFWVFPGTIEIVDDFVDWQGIPVGNPDHGPPGGTLEGLGFPGATFELCSLYADGDPEPNQSGDLFTFTFDNDCNVFITENVVRGGVVLESGASASIAQGGSHGIECGNIASIGKFARWKQFGRPPCWCGKKHSNRDLRRQCYGDVDGTAQGGANRVVWTRDAAVFKAAWGKTEADLASVPTALAGTEPVELACADLDFGSQGGALRVVWTRDAGIFKGNWGAVIGDVDPNCPFLQP